MGCSGSWGHDGSRMSLLQGHSQSSVFRMGREDETLSERCATASEWPLPPSLHLVFPSVITLHFPVTEAAGKLVSFSSLQRAGAKRLARAGLLRRRGLGTSPAPSAGLCGHLSPVYPGHQLMPCLFKWPVITVSPRWVSESSGGPRLDPGAQAQPTPQVLPTPPAQGRHS